MAIPRTEPELAVWLNNFATSFTAHSTALGFNPEVVDDLLRDAAVFQYLVGDLVPTYQAALQARTAYKNLLKDGPVGAAPPPVPVAPATGPHPPVVAPGILPRVRQLVARIKASPNYNESVGRDLGISGDDSAAPAGPSKPTAKASALPGGEVKIEFSKSGFDGVLIEGRRAGETTWSRLGTDNFSPYTDTRPPLETGKPEVREYRLRFLERDEPVGEWSDIISTSTKP
ncbi:MAG: hypothetical protein M3416_10580 [Acidobacteriota bacterium]|nr:hypothetical protein [Acidobacteriota bacterium]